MHPQVRMALLGIGLLAAVAAISVVVRMVSSNVTALRSWTRVEGTIAAMPASDHVEVRLGENSDARPIVAAPLHPLGLAVFKKVTVYIDPADGNRIRFGGLLQMWLLPAGLALAASVALAFVVAIARWPAAPPFAADIVVRPPAPDWKAPFFWSLLGIAAIAISVFSRGAATLPRIGFALLGVLELLIVWSVALSSRTMEVAANATGMRQTSAFGWREARWDQIARVERRLSMPETRKRNLTYDLPFPGNESESYVFADRRGFPLIRMGVAMEPAGSLHRLLDLCHEKTGLRPERNTVRVPDF